MPKKIVVQGPDGRRHTLDIAGDVPTADELQTASDSLYGAMGPTTSQAAQGRTAQQQMLGEARTIDQGISGAYETQRQFASGGLGMSGALLGGAMGGPIGAGIGGALGAAVGPLVGEASEEARTARKAGLGLSGEELLKESAGQAATSAAIDLGTAGLGRAAKGLVGLGKGADIASEIDKAAEVGIRTTAFDVGRPWLETYRRVASIIPILGAPLRAGEKNRSAEIAKAVMRFRGPLEPLIGEASVSSELLKAAAHTYDHAVPWYKEFYKEVERYGRTNPVTFNSTGAVGQAQEYAQILERGQVQLGRPRPPATIPTEEPLTELVDAKDVGRFLEQFQHYPSQMNWDQYDRAIKNIDRGLALGSDSQKVALYRIREQLQAAAETTNDPQFNDLLKMARTNMRVAKEFFENPQAKKFKLVDKDIFGDNQPLGSIDTKETSQLYRTLFRPEIGADGVENIAKMVGPETMRKVAILNVRQRIDDHLVNAADGKVDWSAIYNEFGFNNKDGLRYQTFKKILDEGHYPMSIDEYEQGLKTLERYTGRQLPELATQYIRSISLGGPSAMLGNFSGSRVLNQATGGGKNFWGGLLAKAGVVGSIVGLRDFSRFLADPDRLKVLVRYANEAGEGSVPGLGATIPGLIPGTATEVGAGGRAVVMSANKTVRRQLEKQMLRWLAFDLASSAGVTPQERRNTREQLYDDMVWALEHPADVRQGAGPTPTQTPGGLGRLEREYTESKSLFDRYLRGVKGQ